MAFREILSLINKIAFMNIACYSVIALLPNKKMLISTLKVMSGGKKN